MDIGLITDKLISKLKVQTLDYNPNPINLLANKNKALYGAVGFGVAMIVGAPLLKAAALTYAGVKGYQAIRDWADK
ncbi:MAG: hypothetical protein KKF89_03790 [Nanoarchaeota archaeon]|nr:hypothetical protein [Nanoarchaeota archaeon]MBU1854818.1 hypothetical protein [Nanoarchaeota archaeon]